MLIYNRKKTYFYFSQRPEKPETIYQRNTRILIQQGPELNYNWRG